MLKVLVHPLGARSPTLYPHVPVISRLLLSLLVFLLVTSSILAVTAQEVLNGQVITQGLSVVDSPQPNSVLNAGSNTDISIDVSSVQDATAGIDSLEVFLVSSDFQKNVTVSSGPQLLTQEPGSTVKHIRYIVPACLQTGAYNLTVYETSHINDASFFAITPIPIQVRNNDDAPAACDASTENPLQEQPQPSDPPPPDLLPDSHNNNSGGPTAPASTSDATGSEPTPAAGGGVITVTAGDGKITVALSDLPGTIVVEPSGGAPPGSTDEASSGFTTIFKTVASTATATFTQVITAPVTITFEETYVSTLTAPGTTQEFTVTQTIVSTTEVVATQTGVSGSQQGGLLPINSAVGVPLRSTPLLHWTSLACWISFVFAVAV